MAKNKLWDKGFSIDEKIERFTVGKDRSLDLLLAPWDILGTLAHVRMLTSVGLLSKDELARLQPALRSLYVQAREGKLLIEDDVEDIHSQVELLLTRELGELGKKVHTGRSRNDQVLVDLKLFSRAAIEKTVHRVEALFRLFQRRSEENKEVLMPGYTHLQVAMPSSFGLWFGAWAEALSDDMHMMVAAWKLCNRNPLGSAAGYGSSAPLNRSLTTRLLGFEKMDWNSICAQLSRGKTEWTVASAYASIAATLARFAADCCLYGSQNFGFVRLPRELTTGSSIMPHKKNPDVFELLRAHFNRIAAVPESIRSITANLPSGYFRDMQLLKELYLPLFAEMDDCLDIALFAVEHLEVVDGLMNNPLYATAFSVEEVNRLVREEGVPFREAYRKAGEAIEAGSFKFNGKLHHTHEGSIGNLANDEIAASLLRTLADFDFSGVHGALDALLKGD
ncbi:MAG: argininosuccinate lyase [Bacteroidales bacterium]|nr:argininosuccinate lyase [Bacteroidales bacterium]